MTNLADKLKQYRRRKTKQTRFDKAKIGKIDDSFCNNSYFHCMDVYNETGNFAVLAHAFTYFHESGYQMPVELSNALNKHLNAFVYAENKDDGLAALGFDSNKKGGAWQGTAAFKALNRCLMLKSVYELLPKVGVPFSRLYHPKNQHLAGTGLTEKDKVTMDDIFSHVAFMQSICRETPIKAATIKRLYHEFKKVGQP